ncbi:unnamed protein product [Diabrotica balteata]|uniref:Glycosyl hydrolases family 39 N-terminal catalytic domain-containing protein n=1 Tax=Diabrotica balteata TaxID=107213 RepID=A0A9N9XER5_DIABA|nr:unnamed protein product [Diabrotica balteata]
MKNKDPTIDINDDTRRERREIGQTENKNIDHIHDQHQALFGVSESFGVEIVSKWRFESWNEPDLKGYNCLNMSVLEYLDYVSATNEGLKSAFSASNSTYKFGGPAGLFRDKNHPLCWGILEFCSSASIGVCPLKFVSFHRKGGGSAKGVVDGSLVLIDKIFEKFPMLKKMPVSNEQIRPPLFTTTGTGTSWDPTLALCLFTTTDTGTR